MKIEKIALLTIFLLAFILRFYKLGEVPLTLDWDENSNAYNAYSILKTGKDEYGTFLPITNRSFEDYKPPLYMYLNIPTVAIFGLTPFAARLPSALFGFLTVPAIYFLAKWLFKGQNKNLSKSVPIVSAFLLSISPWHLQFSRVGFEATVGLFLAVAAITAFLYGLSSKKWLIASAFTLALSAYSYHSERIFVPLLFIGALLIWKKDILSIPKKHLLLFVTLTVILALPLAVLIPPKVIIQRFEVTTGRPRLEDIERSIKFILQDAEGGSPFANIVHNRRLLIGQTYFGNYLSHFSFNFLFGEGDDNFRHHIQDMGMLYLFELPLLATGAYLFITNKRKESIFLLIWLLAAPIAATPATPNPHANRSLPMIVALEIISAYSLVYLFSRKLKLKNYILAFFLLIMAAESTLYLHNYWVHYPSEKATFWQYGYGEAVIESEKVKDEYTKINVDHSLEQAYAFWLFATKYDPSKFQEGGDRHHFDKYFFDAKAPTDPKELFVSDSGNFPGGFELVKTIYYPDGTEAIKIGHAK